MYANDLVLCGEWEEDLRAMAGYFAEVCRRRGLKVNAGKSKMMVIGGEEGLQCKVFVDVIRAEHVSEFKYLRCVLDEPGTDEAERRKKQASGRSVTCANSSLVIARSLQLECARVSHESLLVPVVTYGSEKIIWRGGGRRDLGLGLYSLLGIRRMDKVPNARKRQF